MKPRQSIALATAALALAVGPPHPAAAQAAFPGQWAPSSSRYPVWPSGCRRFEGEERGSCLEAVAFDYGTLARFARANAELAPPGRKERRVVFFGDSITDNWSAPGYGGFFPGRPYVNRGIGGQTTSQMLLRFRADVVALRPRAVVILAGTNDIGGNGGPIALGAVQDNLAAMTEQARSAGIRVVLATLLPVSDDKSDEGGAPLLWTRDHPAETISALNRWIAEHARAHRHVVLDYFKATVDGRGLLRPDLTDDGLHPNAAGYAVMAPLAEHSIDRVLR